MKFSTKSRYGLTALIDLAVNSENGKVALGSIAERNGISLQYLEQIFAALRRAGIVKGIKGPQGGYVINDSLSSIRLADILMAVDGSYLLENEIANTPGESEIIAEIIQEKVVDAVNDNLNELLESITLADLVKQYRERATLGQVMYYI